MDLFVIIKQGVYQHGIFGIFADEDTAVGKAKVAIANEPDDYHWADVFRVQSGMLSIPPRTKSRTDPEWPLIAKVVRRGKEISVEKEKR